MILTGWESVFFWIFSIAAIFAALLTVMARNTIHSALFLISSLVSVAALFVLLRAEFIAGVQILVYVGGVMVLFLFVIMLVNVGSEERGSEEIFNRSRQVTTSVIFCALLVGGLLYAINVGYEGLQKRDENAVAIAAGQRTAEEQNLPAAATGSSRITKETERVGNGLYRYGSLPFEIASVLLLVAIIGSVMLARTLKQEAAVDDTAPEVLQAEARYDPEIAKLQNLTQDENAIGTP
jgi:NADH-quinone oxidoreductase subunit J